MVEILSLNSSIKAKKTTAVCYFFPLSSTSDILGHPTASWIKTKISKLENRDNLRNRNRMKQKKNMYFDRQIGEAITTKN